MGWGSVNIGGASGGRLDAISAAAETALAAAAAAQDKADSAYDKAAEAHDNLKELFTSVSEGKAAVASAITDEGVSTSPVAAFSVLAANIKKIFGVKTGDATATAADILSGKTAYAKGSKVTGSIVTKTASDLSVSGKTVTVPAGYYASQVTKSVSSATQATPVISIDSSGLITVSAAQSEGYVSSGTKSATKQLTTQAAKTVTPGTSEQTAVDAGRYTTGAVKVAGDSNLIASNIKSGVSIFGVSGNYAESPAIQYKHPTASQYRMYIFEAIFLLDKKISIDDIVMIDISCSFTPAEVADFGSTAISRITISKLPCASNLADGYNLDLFVSLDLMQSNGSPLQNSFIINSNYTDMKNVYGISYSVTGSSESLIHVFTNSRYNFFATKPHTCHVVTKS